MSGGLIRVDKAAGRWEAVPVALIEHVGLSRGAVGLAAWLLCRRDGFEVRMAALPRLLTNPVEHVGREKLRRWLRELQAAGYVRRTRARGMTGRWDWSFVLSAYPQAIDGFPVDGSAVGGKPVGGSPVDGRPADKQQTLITIRPEQQETKTTTTEPVVVVGLDAHVFLGHEPAIRRALLTCPGELRQQVLDEVAGIAAAGRLRSNAAALVRTLSRAASGGTFEPAAGVAIAAQRRREAEEAKRRAAEAADRQRKETPEAREASRQARDAAFAKLAWLRPAPSPSVAADSPPRGTDR